MPMVAKVDVLRSGPKVIIFDPIGMKNMKKKTKRLKGIRTTYSINSHIPRFLQQLLRIDIRSISPDITIYGVKKIISGFDNSNLFLFTNI